MKRRPVQWEFPMVADVFTLSVGQTSDGQAEQARLDDIRRGREESERLQVRFEDAGQPFTERGLL